MFHRPNASVGDGIRCTSGIQRSSSFVALLFSKITVRDYFRHVGCNQFRFGRLELRPTLLSSENLKKQPRRQCKHCLSVQHSLLGSMQYFPCSLVFTAAFGPRLICNDSAVFVRPRLPTGQSSHSSKRPAKWPQSCGVAFFNVSLRAILDCTRPLMRPPDKDRLCFIIGSPPKYRPLMRC